MAEVSDGGIQVVPGYYHRRSATGDMENSTCCNNTASEHTMMGRLIVDDLVHWATTYKVDGFRFDLMGHLMLSVVERARDALRALTVEQHGVDGSKIYLYGEGWDYAEVRSVARGHSRPCQTLTRSIRIIHTACTQVENNQRGVNASQWNLAHTGVGSFNDRIREACNGEWRPPHNVPARLSSPIQTHRNGSGWVSSRRRVAPLSSCGRGACGGFRRKPVR
jgi:pullulanase